MDDVHLAAAFTGIRLELVRYVTRLTGTPESAEDVVQTTYVRAHEALGRAPCSADEVRRWLFRIATNLALDELRRRKRWQADDVIELRQLAEGNPAFMARSAAMAGSPEMLSVVREHIDTCFGCVLRNLPAKQAVTVLLRELHDFSIVEIAEILGARPAQVKNWLQAGRRTMQDRYAETCALVTKRGVCHQCSELSDYFRAPGPHDIGVTDGSMDQRLHVIRVLNDVPLGRWHRDLLTVRDRGGTQ